MSGFVNTLKNNFKKRRIITLTSLALFVASIATVSAYAITNVYFSSETEAATLSGQAATVLDSTASGSSVVKFGATAPSCTGTSDPWGGCWPDATNTGTVTTTGCPANLQQVDTSGDGYQVNLNQDGMVYENKEIMNETVLRVRANNVTIRCVKMHGIGWYGIDNTEINTVTGTVLDRVDVDCQDKGFVVGLLLHDAVVSKANVHNCDHMINSAGNNLTVEDSYCHDLTNIPGQDIHADCIQNMGGNTGNTYRHNSMWGWDTSDILLGQEYGDASDVIVEKNRFMSDPNKTPPAYLLYLSGTDTIVRDNFFTKRYTYGHCTNNTVQGATFTWTNNRWWEDNTVISGC